MQETDSHLAHNNFKNTQQFLETALTHLILNPTGDIRIQTNISKHSLYQVIPSTFNINIDRLYQKVQIAFIARTKLDFSQKATLTKNICDLCNQGYLHSNLTEKFTVPANQEFLNKGFKNAESIWQIALVAHWALNSMGLQHFSDNTWKNFFPNLPLINLIQILLETVTFKTMFTLKGYRRDAMRHYPKISREEFSSLQGNHWQEVIDHPSGRKAEDDIPLISPTIKQGDIEHSLYRHFLMPDLLRAMRDDTPTITSQFDFSGADMDLLYGLPFVIQQVEKELFDHVKKSVETQIRHWAKSLQASSQAPAIAISIAEKIWGYRRTPAAHECSNPLDNLVKGFSATIRNAFSHLTDVNFAASAGSRLDPMDVAEKFVLFASVSNGQLDNLATAHDRYIRELDNPANWDNEIFFSHFLAVNRESDPHHIQAHFIVDKTRGCPAIPQITRFHEIVMDLILNFVIREFGETNVRGAGAWFLKEKTPSGFA